MFLKHANLKYFNKTILNYSLTSENNFFIDILLKSPNKSVFLDIGAYDGNTCIFVSKKLKENNRKDIQVLAFEPKKSLCESINKKAKQEKLNLKCINLVVSNNNDKIYMKQDQGSGTMYHKKFNGLEYDSDTLDNILKQLSIKEAHLIKIDVEGLEPEVLQGAKNILKNTKHIYIEVWNDIHLKERNGIENGSHNKNILDNLKNFYPIQKIEKNIYFKNKKLF